MKAGTCILLLALLALATFSVQALERGIGVGNYEELEDKPYVFGMGKNSDSVRIKRKPPMCPNTVPVRFTKN